MHSRTTTLRNRVAAEIDRFMRPVLAADSAFRGSSVCGDILPANYKASIDLLVDRVKQATARSIARDQAPDPAALKARLEKIDPGATNSTPSRDAIRKRLTNDKARKAFDDMSDADLQQLISSLGLGNDADPANPNDLPRNAAEQDNDEDDAGERTSVIRAFLSSRMNADDVGQAMSLVDAYIADADDGTVGESSIEGLIEFLEKRLDDNDLRRVVDLVEGLSRTTNAPSVAQDERLRRTRVLAMDSRVRREEKGRETFAKMFPRALPGRSLDAVQSNVRPVRDTSPAAEAVRDAFRAKFPSRVG